jgi:hypothetical protein
MSEAILSVEKVAANDTSHVVAMDISVAEASFGEPSYREAFDKLFNPVDEAGMEVLRSIYRATPPKQARLRSPDRKLDNSLSLVPPRPFVRNINTYIIPEHQQQPFFNLSKG